MVMSGYGCVRVVMGVYLWLIVVEDFVVGVCVCHVLYFFLLFPLIIFHLLSDHLRIFCKVYCDLIKILGIGYVGHYCSNNEEI